jgi:peroxiredoxin
MKWLSSILGRGTGGQKMAALEPGTTAPVFTLSTMEGKQFSLQEALGRGPVLLAFFKVSCPTCQYAFPFFQRLFEIHGNKAFTLVGVSQNGKKDTGAFLKEYGITFPVLLDDTSSYPVSNVYGLTNVPTVFWIAPDGEIEISSVGWSRKDMEEFNRRIAQVSSQSTPSLFRPDEHIADFRAG